MSFPQSSPVFYKKRENFEEFDQVGLWEQYSTTWHVSYEPYFKYILNYPIQVANETEALEFKEKEEVQEMPVFPYEGSVKLVEGKVVVKFSE